MENRLYGKTIIWNGDSICAGSSITGNWATRIAERNDMVCKNYAIGGGTIAEGLKPTKNGKPRHSVSATLDVMKEEYPNADYVMIEGGTNDADLLGFAVLGDKVTKLGSFERSIFAHCGNIKVAIVLLRQFGALCFEHHHKPFNTHSKA